MKVEISQVTQNIANSPNLLAYEGAVLGAVGAFTIAAVEDTPISESPFAEGFGVTMGAIICLAGLAQVARHAWQHAHASRPFSR